MEGGVTGPALFAPTSPTPPPPAFPLPALISNSVAQSVPQLIVKKMNPTVKKNQKIKNQNLTKRNKQIILRGEVLCPVVSVGAASRSYWAKIFLACLFFFSVSLLIPVTVAALEFAREKLKGENPLFPFFFG